jgi:hypothetical protein
MLARAGTEEEAASLALGILRQPGIASFAEENSRARAAKLYFGAARDRALRKEWWNFATGWNQPPQAVAMVHPSALKKVFALPADCLKVRFVLAGGAGGAKTSDRLGEDEWAVEAYAIEAGTDPPRKNCLITNAAAPLVCYTRSEGTVGLWDAEFLSAFACELAAQMGPQLGISAARARQLIEDAMRERDDAAKSDAQEKAPQLTDMDTSWITVRRIGGR